MTPSSRLRWHRARAARAALALVGSATVARAQQADTLPSVLSYRTTEVAPGVYAFVTPTERTGLQSGNSIAVIGTDGVLVFDTGNIPGATRRQIAEIRKLTPKPVRYVVNSHWHPDHNLGNAEYRAAFPGVVVIGTSATRDGITERMELYFRQLREFAATDSLMRLRLQTGVMRDGSPMPADVRRAWTATTRDYREFWPEVRTARPSPPDLVFDDSLRLDLGGRSVRLVRVGRANTAGDAIMIVDDARVVATGDLVTDPCPFPSTSFVTEWIGALDRLIGLRPAAFIPGHGDVLRDDAYVRLVRDLLAFTADKARVAARRGLTLEQARKDIDFAAFQPRFTHGDPYRIDAFNNFWVGPGVQRAYEEAVLLMQTPIPPG